MAAAQALTLPRPLIEWIMTPPTHLTMDEAMSRAAQLALTLTPDWGSTERSEFLLMLMLFWYSHSPAGELEFNARFFDWKKLTP